MPTSAAYLARTRQALAVQRQLRDSPVVALLGARQVGKSVLARAIAANHTPHTTFDLEDPIDLIPPLGEPDDGTYSFVVECLRQASLYVCYTLEETGLPLPLGANVARRDLGADTLRELSDVLAESIRAGLENRERALEYALQFGRGLDDELADRFVGMYVNELTEDYGEEGRRAVRELLRRGEEIGAFTEPVRVEFVS